MPIKVSCKCGAAFAAPDNLAGKAVKCPKCSAPLSIPAGPAAGKPAAPSAAAPKPGAAKPNPQAPAANKNVAKPPANAGRPAAPRPSAPAMGGIADLLDEAGLTSHAGPRCPSCMKPMSPGAVFCVNCGFNAQTGSALSGAEAPKKTVGHGEAADSIMSRAAAEIAATPVASRSLDAGTGKSIWTWVFLPFIPLLMALSLAIVVLWGGTFAKPAMHMYQAIMAGQYELLIPGLLIMIGLALSMFGWWGITSVAIDENFWQGLICLVTFNVYAPIYGMINYKKCRYPMDIHWGGSWCMALANACTGAIIFWRLNMPIMMLPIFLAFVGALITWLGWFKVTITAFEEGTSYGLLCMFVPFYQAVYGCLRWDRCKRDMIIYFAGFAFLIVTLIAYFVVVAVGALVWNFGDFGRVLEIPQ